MKLTLNRHRFFQSKATQTALIALFLCACTFRAEADTNIVIGTAFSTNVNWSMAPSIYSSSNGFGMVDVGSTNTSNISITHQITNGLIRVRNDFVNLTLNMVAEGKIGGFEGTSHSAALDVTGGVNLKLLNGSIIGKTSTTNGTNGSGLAAKFVNVENVRIDSTQFQGGSIVAEDKGTIGQHAIYVENSSLTFVTNNATIISVKGGDSAGDPFYPSSYGNVGGSGLVAVDGSEITVHKGTFTGGESYSSVHPGYAIYSSNSTVTITDGEFSAGKGGAEALYIIDSSTANIISGGTFNAAASNKFSMALVDSDLTISGGQFNGAGLYADVRSNGVNHIDLMGGELSALHLVGEGVGTQYITVTNDISIVDGIWQYGGNVVVTNYTDAPLQQITLLSGNMTFENDLVLTNSGLFSVVESDAFANFHSLDIQSNAVLSLQNGQFNASSNLTVHADGVISFKLEDGHIDLNNSIAGIATFQTNAIIEINSAEAGLSAGTNNFVLLTATNQIYTGGSIPADSSTFSNDVKISNNIVPGIGRTAFKGIVIEDGNKDLVAKFFTPTLREWWDADGQLGSLGDDLDGISNRTMMAIMDTMTADQAKTVTEEAYFTVLNTMQVALQGQDAAIGQAVSRSSDFREMATMKPAGVRGPKNEGQGMHGWAKYYGQFASHDAKEGMAGYDATLHGGVIGVDKSFGKLLIGVMGGAGNYKIEADNAAESTSDAYHGALYTTIGGQKGYLEAGLGYGYYSTTTKTGGPFTLEGEYDSSIISAYLGGGYGVEFKKAGTILTPEVAINFAQYMQDAYSETGTNAVPREFNEFDAESLRTKLGASFGSYRSVDYQTFSLDWELRAHWMHELNADAGTIGFGLENGSTDYLIAYPLLDEDIYRAGIGLIFRNPVKEAQNVMLRIDFDELFGDGFNSHNFSAKVLYAF